MCEGLSVKKHFSQMTNQEKYILRQSIDNLQGLEIATHVSDRLKEKNICEHDIFRALDNYNIIEYHRRIKGDYADNRVLIRSKYKFKGRNICMSISLDNGRLITAYCNYDSDNHSTINMSNYNNNINILKYIKCDNDSRLKFNIGNLISL